jgi:hypothetical protein
VLGFWGEQTFLVLLPKVLCTLQDKMEKTTVTEESDMHETGLSEESETENVELIQ